MGVMAAEWEAQTNLFIKELFKSDKFAFPLGSRVSEKKDFSH